MRGVRLAVLGRAILLAGILSVWNGADVLTSAHAAPKAQKGGMAADGEDVPIEGEAAGVPVELGAEEDPQSRPVPPTSGPPAPVAAGQSDTP